MPKAIKFCVYNGCAAQFDDREAWVLDANGWYETAPVFVRYRAPLTKQAFREAFGDLPPLPPHAFDPERKIIRYARHDGFPVRLADDGEIWTLARNGTWVVPSRPAQLFCYDAGLVSEREFRRSFGDVPPLPPAAFRS